MYPAYPSEPQVIQGQRLLEHGLRDESWPSAHEVPGWSRDIAMLSLGCCPAIRTTQSQTGNKGHLCSWGLFVHWGARPLQAIVGLAIMAAPTKSTGVLISQGLVVLGMRPPVSYTEFSGNSLLMKCSGSNLFTEIRSLDSVPGPASILKVNK